MKRYLFPVAAALAFALGVTGGALAEGHPAKSHHAKRQAPAVAGGHVHSLIPGFAPHPRMWLRALRELRHNQKPPRKAKPKSTHRHATKRHGTKPQAPKPKPEAQAARAAPSAASPAGDDALDLRAQRAAVDPRRARAASAARRHESGIVVLDFGKPAFQHGGYGTLLFSGRFAPNRKITNAMLGYARGYVSLPPEGLHARSIELARGTSNYHPSVPSAYAAGVRWARETNRLGRKLAPERARRRTSRRLPPTTPSPPGTRPSARRVSSSTASARRCTGTRSSTTARSTAESARSGAPGRRGTSPAGSAIRKRCPRSTTPRWRSSGPSSRGSRTAGTTAPSASRAS